VSNARLACFISPHGLGHAARAAAILSRLQEAHPDLILDLFTIAPLAFFEASGCRNIVLHPVRTDLGFVQRSALAEDIPETIHQLDECLPFDPAQVERLAGQVRQSGCSAILCDIAPLGFAVAQSAGIPSILVENFRWDDLYEHYAGDFPAIRRHVDLVRPWFDRADLTIQTEPLCRPVPAAALVTGPVSRPPRQDRDTTRHRLGIRPDQKMVLITMGGVSERTPLLAHLAARTDLMFVVAWGADRIRLTGNVLCLPLQSEFYHPDLVHAADAVIGKAGYSTLAEVYHAGVPFGYISRRNYPEMPALIRFIQQHMAGASLHDADLGDGVEPGFIDRLVNMDHHKVIHPNGSGPIANTISQFLRL
jgi:hypothetical protein